MKKTNLKVISCVAASTLSLVAMLAGCSAVTSSSGNSSKGGGQGSTSSASANAKVAMIPKAMGIPYFEGAGNGAKQEAPKQNISLDFNGPTTLSASDQVSMINSDVAQGYKAITLAANDPTSLAPALKAAKQKGVKVVTFDSDVLPEARDFFVNQATNESIADSLVKLVSQHFKGTVDVAIISSSPSSTNQNAWIADMKKVASSKYSNVNFVTIQYGQDQPAASLTAAENILKGYPNVKAIIAPDSVGLPAAAEAIEKLGKKGQIYLTGLADPVVMKQYVNDGTVDQFELWDVEKMGALVVDVAKAAVEGKMPKNGTFHDGSLGDFQVTNGEVVLGPPMVFDKSNVNKYSY